MGRWIILSANRRVWPFEHTYVYVIALGAAYGYVLDVSKKEKNKDKDKDVKDWENRKWKTVKEEITKAKKIKGRIYFF